IPAEARAAPTVPTVPLRKRRLLSALCCSAANISSSSFVIRHTLLRHGSNERDSSSQVNLALLTIVTLLFPLRAFPHSKAQPAAFRATTHTDLRPVIEESRRGGLALSGPSIRRKCHENAMSLV